MTRAVPSARPDTEAGFAPATHMDGVPFDVQARLRRGHPVAMWRSGPGAEQAEDTSGVRYDMADGGDTGESAVCRNERLGTRGPGCRGQDRIERAEAGPFRVQPQAFAQVGFLDDKQW